MPVLVTAAESVLGQLAVARLLRTGGQVRAFVGGTGDVQRLRRAGAVVAAGDLLDEGHLEAALEQVHTVVHLAADPLVASADLVLEQGATVVTAAIGAGVQRLVLLSLPGADPQAGDPLRRVCGEVEELVAAAPFPSVALRSSLVDTTELREALVSASLGPGALDNVVAPVRAQDAVEAVAFLDEIRSTAHEGHVVMTAVGPEPLTLAGYLERVGVGAPGRVGRLVGRVWRGPDAHPLLADVLAGPWLLDNECPSVWEVGALTPQPVGA